MKRGIALVVVAACGSGPDAASPREPVTLRLVECASALPTAVGDVRAKPAADRMVSWSSGKNVRRAVTLGYEMAQTSGMMDAMVVRRVVQAKASELTKCYERELAINPTRGQTRVAWRFSVAQDGHVVFADPTTQVVSVATSACISRVVKTMTFPARTTGGSITITQGLVFDAIPIGDRRGAVAEGELPWTPYPVRGGYAPAGAEVVAHAAESILKNRADKLEACFRSGGAGSLRALFSVESDGDVVATRVGGIGNDAIEACVEKQLVGAKLVNPLGDTTEIACDFARGDAQPWRVSASASYGVITATRKDMTYDKQTVVVGAVEPAALPGDRTYLIVAEPETSGAVLNNALAWATDGDAAIVALRDGAGPPRYLGMGKVGAGDAEAGFGGQPLLVLGRGTVQACLGRKNRRGKLADAGSLAQQLATLCRTSRCGALAIALDDLALARDLVEVTGAARRAGFERVTIGGPTMCEGVEKEIDEDGP